MAVYRDAAHCIARVMSIETNTLTAQAAWQRRYQSGFVGEVKGSSGLSAEERLAQDAMVRALLRRKLSKVQWHAIVARYSINDLEVAESIRHLVIAVETPAHHLFKMKSVAAWAVPTRFPAAFYVLHSWDNEGTPERTLRRWRSGVYRWLHARVDEAHVVVEGVLQECGLLNDDF